ACFPLVAGVLLYGWRAAGSIAIVLVTSALAILVWQRIGARGGQVRYSHSLWLALLLGLTLPPHLLTDTFHTRADQTIATWPLLPAAGLIIVPLIWVFGGLGSGRLHPVLLANLVLVMLFGGLLEPHYTLQRNRIFVGDVMDTGRSDPDEPIGTSCEIAVIIGGLFMLYRGVIDYRIPLLMILATYAAILVLPVPISIDSASGELSRHWQWLAIRNKGVGPALAVTFANYEM